MDVLHKTPSLNPQIIELFKMEKEMIRIFALC